LALRRQCRNPPALVGGPGPYRSLRREGIMEDEFDVEDHPCDGCGCSENEFKPGCRCDRLSCPANCFMP
jgi:hypothetical protein